MLELVEERKIKSKQPTLNYIHMLTSNLDGTLQTSHANLILHNWGADLPHHRLSADGVDLDAAWSRLVSSRRRAPLRRS